MTNSREMNYLLTALLKKRKTLQSLSLIFQVISFSNTYYLKFQYTSKNKHICSVAFFIVVTVNNLISKVCIIYFVSNK